MVNSESSLCLKIGSKKRILCVYLYKRTEDSFLGKMENRWSLTDQMVGLTLVGDDSRRNGSL
jgi:hypothetical protein